MLALVLVRCYHGAKYDPPPFYSSPLKVWLGVGVNEGAGSLVKLREGALFALRLLPGAGSLRVLAMYAQPRLLACCEICVSFAGCCVLVVAPHWPNKELGVLMAKGGHLAC